MRFYRPFTPDSLSYRERLGDPPEFEAALGALVIAFQALAGTIALALASRLTTDAGTAAILAAELSFRQRVHLLGALVRGQASVTSDPQPENRIAQLEELLACCVFVEGKHHRLMASWWPGNHQGDAAAVRRRGVVRDGGIQEEAEPMSSSRILDVADYCAYLSMMLEEYFDLGLFALDSVKGS
jgi:hypothetical protein